MAQYMDTDPAPQVSLHVANTAEISAKVLNFELDVGLIEGEIHHSELDVVRWQEDELVVFCAPDHPYANRQQLSDQDLLDARWILREQGSGTRQSFDRAMHGLLPDLHVLLELQHTEAIKRAVAAGMGIGCLSRIALTDAFSHRRFVPLRVKNRDLHRYFYFILHRQKYRGAGLVRWLELCQKSAY